MNELDYIYLYVSNVEQIIIRDLLCFHMVSPFITKTEVNRMKNSAWRYVTNMLILVREMFKSLEKNKINYILSTVAYKLL